ncbi:hypothetical protein OGAPHI_000914 [Ogataea philodendri]|uniref:4-hydroxy-3-methoxy-5-polyprenylbenzoate decarboxylase n=1 Tax=Ogataea philodendri TaxID=1378263 RepID=A0A9P8T9B6_9ASCO|nr:uncharacterized protein OGAPHI_000914 [Ogataea philodendri]KAH3670399.1 hypothetical protein OGAPHI_000914 [Ogataea philodendri]
MPLVKRPDLVTTRQFLSVALAAGSQLYRSISLADQFETDAVQTKAPPKKKVPLYQRPEPNYPNHVPLHPVEKAALFVGSAAGAYLHPERNEFIVALGESTALPYFLNQLKVQMLNDPVGRQILKERPNITSDSLRLDELRKYPENSLARAYVSWLDMEGVSPDTREPVRFIDDEELAFIFQRYRQCHDFYHAITGLPIVREGEIALKLFEFLNLKIPFAGMGALFAPIPIKKSQRSRLLNIYYPWALKNSASCKPLINVYWENILDHDVDHLRAQLGIEKPPDMRKLRKAKKTSL